MCYPAVLTHGNGQSPHLQMFFPFKHLRFVMSISRGMENHPTYGITMDNLTHQGLAITGDTMQQKPLIQGIHGPPIKKKRHRKTMGRIGQGLRSLLS